MSGTWVKELFQRISLALEAIEKGKDYSFDSDVEDDGLKNDSAWVRYIVIANSVTKEADVEVIPRGDPVLNGHFGQEQFKAIQHLIKRCEKRKKWFEDHEDIFFSRPPE